MSDQSTQWAALRTLAKSQAIAHLKQVNGDQPTTCARPAFVRAHMRNSGLKSVAIQHATAHLHEVYGSR